MNPQTITMNGTFQYEDQYKIEFRFFGTFHQEKDLLKKQEELEQKIKKIFESKKNHPTIIETTTYLKTILRELEEISLDIYLEKELDVYHSIHYNNGKLNIYQYDKMKSPTNIVDIELEYNRKTGTKFSFQKDEKEFPNEKILSIINEEFRKETSILSSLQKNTFKNLNKKEQELYEIYRLFFEDNPDFSDELAQEKAQDMLSCLNMFKINMDANIFWLFPQLLENLSLFGKISEEFNPEVLNPKLKKEIKIIGEEIRTYLKDPNTPINTLQELIKIDRAQKSPNLWNDILEESLQNEKILEDKLDSHKMLVKKIRNKL